MQFHTQFLNFINFINFLQFLNFLTPFLLRAPSNKNPLKFRRLDKHPWRYLKDLRYSQKVLVWKSFEQNFNQNFIRASSNVSGLLPETFLTF